MPVPTPAALSRRAPVPLSERAAWSKRDTAHAYGVSERLITRLITEGKLPAARLGRRVLIDPEAAKLAIFGPQSVEG